MSDLAWAGWLVRTAVGGGMLLLIGWLWQRRLREAAQRQRLGEWVVVAALVVAVTAALPAWLTIPVPDWRGPVAAVDAPDLATAEPIAVVAELPAAWEVEDAPPVAAPAVAKAPAPPAWRWTDVVLVGFAAVAAAMLLHWLLANLAVSWLLRKRKPVSPDVAALFAEMAWPRRVRLVVTDRVQVPFSVGLFRPTVVLPEALVEKATTEELRWVLAHELAHVARHDTRTCWLFILGQVLFFYLPWFWWLRRQVRLSQEYIADAAALEWAGSPADYAQFLLEWVRPGGNAARVPAMATSVVGSGSDLFRRVSMMLESKNPCEARVSRSWVAGLAGGLVALGLVVGGVGLRAVRADEKKAEPKKEEKKDPDRALGLEGVDRLLDGVAAGLDEDVAKELRERMAELRKQMDEMRKQMGKGNFQFQGNLPGGAFVFPNNGQFGALAAISPQRQRLGVQYRAPSKTLVDQLDLPKGQGIVLEEVGPNSAAAKAGLKSHDILLELAGKSVSSKTEEFVKQVAEIKANTPVDAVVLRKGKKETVKGLSLPEAKPVAMANTLPLAGGFQGALLPRLAGQGKAIAGGRGAITSVSRNNDEFTTKHKDGDVTLSIKGTIDQGKAKVTEVVVDEGNGQSATYTSIDKVPTTHREKVRKLAEMSAKGSVNFPIK